MMSNSIQTKERVYPSKVLLFGEYCILSDGDALVMPLPAFFAEWDQKVESIDQQLLSFYEYLLTKEELKYSLDLNLLKRDILQGYFLNSNIPLGYGMGSSGAVTSAIYDKYCIDKKIDGLEKLKSIFSLMESYFHGFSSGLDPLASYFNRGIQFNRKDGYSTVNGLFELTGDYSLFLIDSKRPRKTEKHVNKYKNWLKGELYHHQIESKLKPTNSLAIEAFLKQDGTLLYSIFKKISRLQWSLMKDMICSGIDAVWEAGLNCDDFYIKLCGAGGGGMYLGIVHKSKTYLLPSDFPISWLTLNAHTSTG